MKSAFDSKTLLRAKIAREINRVDYALEEHGIFRRGPNPEMNRQDFAEKAAVKIMELISKSSLSQVPKRPAAPGPKASNASHRPAPCSPKERRRFPSSRRETEGQPPECLGT